MNNQRWILIILSSYQLIYGIVLLIVSLTKYQWFIPIPINSYHGNITSIYIIEFLILSTGFIYVFSTLSIFLWGSKGKLLYITAFILGIVLHITQLDVLLKLNEFSNYINPFWHSILQMIPQNNIDTELIKQLNLIDLSHTTIYLFMTWSIGMIGLNILCVYLISRTEDNIFNSLDVISYLKTFFKNITIQNTNRAEKINKFLLISFMIGAYYSFTLSITHWMVFKEINIFYPFLSKLVIFLILFILSILIYNKNMNGIRYSILSFVLLIFYSIYSLYKYPEPFITYDKYKNILVKSHIWLHIYLIGELIFLFYCMILSLVTMQLILIHKNILMIFKDEKKDYIL